MGKRSFLKPMVFTIGCLNICLVSLGDFDSQYHVAVAPETEIAKYNTRTEAVLGWL